MSGGGDDLLRIVAAELARPVPAGAQILAGKIVERYGPAVRAVLFYGSCLRTGDDREGILDLYALVDDYRSCYRRWSLIFLNTLLPPNVFYIEAPAGEAGESVVRAKYAVVSLSAFAQGVSARTFEPYFWARFAQPCALVYVADDTARGAVETAVATAVRTFAERAAALCPPRFRARDLWVRGLSATYRSELRSEREGVAERLFDAAPERYAAVTRAALAGSPRFAAAADDVYFARPPGANPTQVRAAWWLRRLQGKLLSVLRVLRNGLIFEGGVDYLLWKVGRHSGVEVDTGWRRKRWPWLALVAELWRLYRRGAFR